MMCETLLTHMSHSLVIVYPCNVSRICQMPLEIIINRQMYIKLSLPLNYLPVASSFVCISFQCCRFLLSRWNVHKNNILIFNCCLLFLISCFFVCFSSLCYTMFFINISMLTMYKDKSSQDCSV